jgi:hypothetical protein
MSDAFAQTWTARILSAPPMIAPARQFVYPLYVPGEEDAMSRGALLLDVKPANAANFLATCALGFREPSLPTGIFACPRPGDLLAVAGGYAYLSAPSAGVLLLAGFHHVAAIDANGLRWQTARLSWEGVTMAEVRDNQLHGTGWNMQTDREVAFSVDLATGTHTGGGY